MESLSQIANSYALTKSRAHKYSTEQLAEIETVFAQFNVEDLLAAKTQADQDLCLDFFKSEGDNFQIHLTSAQLMYNMR
jgi:hypothetical protein